jgi:hypothetical protein
MNNLINIQERMDIMQAELNTLQLLVNDFKEEQSKPVNKYELSDFMKATIVQLLDRFIDHNVFDSLDRSHQENVSSGCIDIDITFDLQDIVCDQLDSSHRMANNFLDELIRELDELKNNEEDEATESGEQQHQDC